MIEEINNSIKVLKEGNTILFPTETGWYIGCDATNEEAVAKIYEIVKSLNSTQFVCLVSNQAMVERHVTEVPEAAYDIMDLANKPTTIIFDQPKGIAKNSIAEDDTLAIRVVSDKFCQYLINKLGKPIVSISASFSGMPVPKQFKDISPEILKGVDYVANLNHDEIMSRPASIIKLENNGIIKIIRA